ncbi:hypothetical protein HNP38_000569 [Chryseobacterium defluvii]|uniref:Uncharacterized protein n=1 Tax=Chryseobacterium defluvii TaxID=160396 RepID=A0A840KBC1_9FLAO|nr:hypothetical protein [Chryseobacterium defluvii]MBB4805297.1 hypothetical protein [Chryseobacterium defluvii]
MKKLFPVLFLIFSLMVSGQKTKSSAGKNYVSFVTLLDIKSPTKDEGYPINGYMVNLDYEKIKKLNGRKVRISGKVITVKGLTKEGGLQQGRYEDTRHILNPKIKVLN